MGNMLGCLREPQEAADAEQRRRSLAPRRKMTCKCWKKICGKCLNSRVAAEKLTDLNVDGSEENTQQAKTEEELKENKVKIDNLFKWLSYEGHYGVCSEAELNALGDGLQLQDMNDVMDTFAEMGEKLNEHQQALKEHREKLLSKEQVFVLATQLAQSFLDNNGQNLLPEEKDELQNNLNDLKEVYETALLHADTQLNHVEDLHIELQKFRKDHDEFGTCIIQLENELEKIKAGEIDSNSLIFKLRKQIFLFQDLQFHKGDLRYLRRSWRRVVDAANDFETVNENAAFKIQIDAFSISRRVHETAEDAYDRFNILQSEYIEVGTRLGITLYQHFQEMADELCLWLESSETSGSVLPVETISNPESLQKELENITVLQGEVSEHEVNVEKLQEAANCLLSLKNNVVPNVRQLRQTTDAIAQRYQRLCDIVSEHKKKLELSNVQEEEIKDSKSTEGRPTSCAGSRAGSRTNSRQDSDASDIDVLETQSICSDIS